MDLKPKLTKKQQQEIDRIRKEQNERALQNKEWMKKRKRLFEMGLIIGTDFDDCNSYTGEKDVNNYEITSMMRQATEYIRQDKEIPLDFKLKLLRYTRPELFNSDGTPKVDISKLGNIE